MSRTSLAKFVSLLGWPLLAGIAASPLVSACTVIFDPTSVGPSFQVQVSGYNGPVKGLRLYLDYGQSPTKSTITDDQGIARFSNVPLGAPFLRADYDNGHSLPLEVKPKGPANIAIRWPSIEPIRVRSVSGSMRAPFATPGRLEQDVLSLDLLDAISGRVVASLSTGTRGEFDFGRLAPGIYFIRLNPLAAYNQQVSGLISVAVDPQAAPGQLDLNLVWTSCGLSYTDLRPCPRSDLRVRSLSGRMSDESGGAIPSAVVVLRDKTQNQVVRVTTDPRGNFSFPDPLEGTFDLQIEGVAFSPVRATLHLDRTAEAKSLEVRAVYFVGCSTVALK